MPSSALLWLLVAGAVNADKVIYISYSRYFATEEAVTVNSSTVLPYVSFSDDTPMHEHMLSSSFEYFGTSYDRAFINANGHVQLSKIPPCGSYFGYQGCNYNTSYYNTIAGYLADLNPAANEYSTVSLYHNSTQTTFLFSRVPPFGQDTELSFSISLMNDSSVRIHYIDVTPLEDITGDNGSKYHWLSGLRAPQNITSRAMISSEQRSRGAQQWRSSVSGVYALRSDVQNNKVFIACPLSVTWCLTPSVVQSSNWPAEISLTPLSVSCTEDVSISIYISSTSSDSAITASEACTLKNSNNTLLARFVCGTAAFTGVSSGSYYVRVEWRTADTPETMLPIEGLPLTVQSSTAPEQCSLSSTAIGSCSACDVCAGRQLDCLSLPCSDASISASEVSDLYERSSCNNTCDTSIAFDIAGECCAIDEIDCIGKCGGSATNASSSYGGWQICCEVEIDCEGVCGGGKRFDACDVCGGSDTTGETCPTYVRIYTGGDNNNELHVVYDATNTNDDYFVTSVITIANDNDTDITVNFSVTSDFRAPAVSVPIGGVTIQPFSNRSFAINSSIAELINDPDLPWVVKTITVGYIRPTQFSNDLHHHIDLLPSSDNCNDVESPNLCMALPGCIQCIDYEGIRVLRAIDCDDVDCSSKRKRSLYASIIPEIAGYSKHKLQHGICETGWDNSDCSTFNNSSPHAQYSIVITAVMCIIATFAAQW